MAGTHVWPVDAVSGAPLFTGRQGRQLAVAPFVAGATATRPLGAFSGVRPGTPTTTVTATSTTWTVGEHVGIIDAELAAEAGPYTYSFDAAQTGSMTAADPSNPRIDVIYVRIDDPAESDGTSVPLAAAGYQAGTPAATPAAPTSWTGSARSMVLAQINVPKVGGGSPSVTWVAPYLTAPGGIVPNPSSAQQTALSAVATAANPILIDDAGAIRRSIGSGFETVAFPAAHGEWRLSADQSIPSGAFTLITAATAFGTVSSSLTNTAGVITVAAAGMYRVTMQAVWPTNSGKRRALMVTLNGASIDGSGNLSGGSSIGANVVIPAAATDIGQQCATRPVLLAAGDVLRCFAFVDDGAPVPLKQGVTTGYLGTTSISVDRVG